MCGVAQCAKGFSLVFSTGNILFVVIDHVILTHQIKIRPKQDLI